MFKEVSLLIFDGLLLQEDEVQKEFIGFNFNKLGTPITGLKLIKNIRNRNLDKIITKGKNTKNDKFFEELKNIRLTGKK